MDETTRAWVQSENDRKAVADGCYFDAAAAAHVCEFFEKFLRHSKGKWAGQPFILLPWQRQELLMPLFGWRRADGTRRFRQAYVHIPKKNGKSALCSGVSLYLLMADGEPGAEVYNVAADRDQAAIVFDQSAVMVRSSPLLSKRLLVTDSRKTISYPKTHSIYKALTSEHSTKEGLNIHGLIVDEFHAHRDDKLIKTLRYGGAARVQPLQIIITTAGEVKGEGVCYREYEYAKKIDEDHVIDWSYFSLIYEAQDNDDWTDPEVWKRANPSYGFTISEGSFHDWCRKAKESAEEEYDFKRYRLNLWPGKTFSWLKSGKWDACRQEFDPEMLRGRKCYAAGDLSSKQDITALDLVFPMDGLFYVLPFFWLPEDSARERTRRDRVSYLNWNRDGFIKLTEGNVIDNRIIYNDIVNLSTMYDIQEIAFDPWNAMQMMIDLEAEGFNVVEFRQTLSQFSGPMKELEAAILQRQIVHDGNPVLAWMMQNLVARKDANDNIRPDKEKSSEKIDGGVALIMAYGRAIAPGDAFDNSYLAETGIRMI